jgi:hypothetical protein
VSATFYKLLQDLAARTDLLASDKLVYAILADRIGRNGKAWPGSRRLAHDSGMNRETVLESIGRLKAAGLLLVESRGRGRANLYRLAEQSGRETRPVSDLQANAKWPDSPTPGGRKTRPEAAGKSDHNQTDPLNQRGAASPPASKGPNNGELVALFIDLFRETVREPFTGDRGKLAGNLKRLAKLHGPATVEARIRRWFGKDRDDYGTGLFFHKFQSTELRGAGQGAVSGSEMQARAAWEKLESKR